jgi:hypothetical protein
VVVDKAVDMINAPPAANSNIATSSIMMRAAPRSLWRRLFFFFALRFIVFFILFTLILLAYNTRFSSKLSAG